MDGNMHVPAHEFAQVIYVTIEIAFMIVQNEGVGGSILVPQSMRILCYTG